MVGVHVAAGAAGGGGADGAVDGDGGVDEEEEGDDEEEKGRRRADEKPVEYREEGKVQWTRATGISKAAEACDVERMVVSRCVNGTQKYTKRGAGGKRFEFRFEGREGAVP